ncbi:MAG: hypothetical protein O7G84_13815 [Gammaproteobacteria bacterium]|nr:hypothetical protein [Gammaproteobacteria bacterium]
MKKDETIELLTPVCEHGHATARITEGGESFVTSISSAREGEDLQPGETLVATEAIEGQPHKRRIIDKYTRPGPARSATPKYRKNYDDIEWN